MWFRRYRRRRRCRQLHRVRLQLLWTRQACLNLWYDECFSCLLEWSSHGMFIYAFVECYISCKASCKWASKLDVFIRWWNNLIMWWHDRLHAGFVGACQFYINCLTPVLTWIESCSRPSPFRAATGFLQRIRFSKLQTSFRVHTK
jgi:hypothetical protein